ncbi:MAG: NUDIX domain-containing protein [Planctomycetota bacterium]|nr:MAG: NUDIX domain-containing protein [Planctomycetota bacterium]
MSASLQFTPPPLPSLSESKISAAGLLLRRWHGGTDGHWRWLLVQNRKRGEWGFPKGHQDPGESLRETALRECAEETGIALLSIHEPPFELVYALPSGKAKQVAYFPARTSQERVVLSREHQAFAWLPRRDVRKRLIHDTLQKLFLAHVRSLE